MTCRLIPLGEVTHLTGISRSEIYRKIQMKQFPRAYKVGLRASRWGECEILEWNSTRPRAE